MSASRSLLLRGAKLAAACGLFAGTATAGLAAAPTIATGQYYTTELVTGLTGSGGVTDAVCAQAYTSPGTQQMAFTHVTTTNGLAAFNLRFTEAGPSSLFLVHERLTQSAGSTLQNESGTITEYVNGKQAAPPFPYTATATVIDAVSFAATVTAQAPSPTGTGTCTQVIKATFVLAN